jgi:hypothetical protein
MARDILMSHTFRGAVIIEGFPEDGVLGVCQATEHIENAGGGQVRYKWMGFHGGGFELRAPCERIAPDY